MFALTLAVAASLAWVGLDVARKSLARSVPAIPLVVALAGGQAVVFLGWVLIEPEGAPGADYLLPGMASVLLNAAANLLFVHAVSVSPLARTVPLLSLTPVLSGVAAAVSLGERPGGWQVLGAVLVVIGVGRLAIGGGEAMGNWWRAVQRERGTVPMLAVAVLWSFSAACDKAAIDHASAPWHGFVLGAGVAVLMLLVALARGGSADFGALRTRSFGVALAALFGAVAILLQLWSYDGLLVATVETIKRVIGIVLAILLGRMLFGERTGSEVWVPGIAMAIGVALVLLTGS